MENRKYLHHLKTVQEVFDTLGGPTEIGKLMSTEEHPVPYRVAQNWNGLYNSFPARTYVKMQRLLRKRGYTAPADLWGML